MGKRAKRKRRMRKAIGVLALAGAVAAACAPTDAPATQERDPVAPADAAPADQDAAAANQDVAAANQDAAPEGLRVAGARSGFVDTPDGERIHYLEVSPSERVERAASANLDDEPDDASAAADRPALLFVPGWMLPAEIWAPQLERFGATRRTVAMDPRAQGRSSKARDGLYAAARARDIRAVVEALELRPVVLVGWSMGVTEVVAYVEQFGTDGLAGVVLVDGLAGLDFEPQVAQQFLDWGAAYVHERETTTRAFVRSMFRTERSEDYLEALTERALMTPTDAAVALAVSQARSDHRAALRRIDRPTLIAIAPGGPFTALYEAIADSIPGSRLERFEGAGHALFVDRAEDFNARLEAFLAEL